MTEANSWKMERAELGEIPASELSETERTLLRALRADNQAILETYPASKAAPEIRRRLHVAEVAERARRRRTGAMVLAPLLAGAAGMVLFLGDPAPATSPIAGLDTVRMKGQSLLLHRKTASGTELLRNQDSARAGDRLQLGFRLDGPRHVVLLSVDGRGVVTLHLPDSRAQLAPRYAAGVASVPFSYELDDAPHFERFFLVSGPETYPVADALGAAEALARTPDAETAPLDLPVGLKQLELNLRKVKTP